MNRAIFTILAATGLLVLGSIASAASSIVDTKHNLSGSQPSGTAIRTTATQEVCVFCHTPHGADTGVAAPLWNRARQPDTTVFQMYTSPSLDASTGTRPTGPSLACLSCHDGTIAFDALRNQPGSGGFNTAAPSAGWAFANASGGNSMPNDGRITNIGEAVPGGSPDLRNDHPISMRYEDARSPSASSADQTLGFHPVRSGPGVKRCVTGASVVDCNHAAALPLSSATIGGAFDYVQCTTCHDPHRADTPTFLRKSNDASALCLTCHRKDG